MVTRKSTTSFLCGIVPVLVVTLGCLVPPATRAEVFTCPTPDSACLLASMVAAEANPDPDNTLVLAAGTYTLTVRDHGLRFEGFTGTPLVTKTLTVVGQGASQTTITRDPTSPSFRLFDVAESGTLALWYMTLSHGEVDADAGERGGAIQSDGTLIIGESVLSDNSAWIGGAIDSFGPLWMIRSACTNNHGGLTAGCLAALGPTNQILDSLLAGNVAESGGGISYGLLAGESLVLTGSVLQGNTAFLTNGGAMRGVGTVTVQRSLLLDGHAGFQGGAAYIDNGTLTLISTVVHDNSTIGLGGGIASSGAADARVELRRSHVLHNRAELIPGVGGTGGGIYAPEGGVTLRNSSLAHNSAQRGPDCFGTVTALAGTFIRDTTDCTVNTSR